MLLLSVWFVCFASCFSSKAFERLVKGWDKYNDDNYADCGSAELMSLDLVCRDPPQSCGGGLCRCCIDNKNRSHADCSWHFEHGGLHFIPRLPSGIQVLNFSSNLLISEVIGEDFFDNVPNVTHLNLALNGLTYIKSSMFRRLTNLTCLNVNQMLFGINSESFVEMLAIPGLQLLSVRKCSLTVDSVSFAALRSTVQELYVDANPTARFSVYDLTTLSALPALRRLMFGHSYSQEFYTNAILFLEELVLPFDGIMAFPDTCFQDSVISLFPKLKVLDLSSNAIPDNTMSESICLPNVFVLLMDNNLIADLQPERFGRKHFPKLEFIDLRKQSNILQLPLRIQKLAFSNPSLIELHLEDNDILFGSEELVAYDAWENCTNLVRLYLDRNSLRAVDDVRFQKLFGGLQSLQLLSISQCQMEGVSVNTFKTLTNLKSLYLDGNWFSNIPSNTFDSLQNLELLDLSNNKLAYVSEQAFSGLLQNNRFQLGLNSNPFICSCDILWLRKMYRANPSCFQFKVVRRRFIYKYSTADQSVDLTCENLHGLSLANFSLAQQACMLSEQTSVMITYTCSLLVVSLTAFLLLFAFRWHFRLLLYEAFRGTGQARRLRLQQNNFNYDVFVSYASQDLPWVRQHFMPQLEDRLGLKLCIHERDFIIGNNIVDNIAESVESSKKVLMIFSKYFVLSQWCQFELNYCLSHVMGHDDALIIVCVDDVASREMTSAMMAVLKTTTYIQWMEEDYAMRSFWGRIKIALHEILNIGEHNV